MRMRSNHHHYEDTGVVIKKPRRSKSVVKKMKKLTRAPGIENEQITTTTAPKKRTPTKSKSESSKSRVKVLLGGMFGKRPSRSSSSTSRTSSSSLQLEALLAPTTYYPGEQQQSQPQPKQLFPTMEQPAKLSVEEEGVHDVSQTTVASLSPLLDESEKSFVVDIRLIAEPDAIDIVAQEEPQEEEEEVAEENLEEKQEKAATLLQTLFRGYKQRYEYQMLILRQKLHQIQANKERQLIKLAQRTKTRKRQAKSVVDFHDPHEKTARQLQRVARIIPYLFREAQTKMKDNVLLASSSEHAQELEESHMNLRVLAHTYLESLEDLPGIWEALKAQWMSPKKPRPRRSFGPDGKIIKHSRMSIHINTHDEDLPVDNNNNSPPSSPSRNSRTSTSPWPSPMARAACDDSNEHSNLFVNLFIQATASEIYSTEEDIDQAVVQFHDMVGKAAWN